MRGHDPRAPHDWSDWGLWEVEPPSSQAAHWVANVPPTLEPIEAYRWRVCACGARERERFHGERQVFLP